MHAHVGTTPPWAGTTPSWVRTAPPPHWRTAAAALPALEASPGSGDGPDDLCASQVSVLQTGNEGTGCLGSQRCVIKHSSVWCNPQQGAGMVQHAIAQDMPDGIAFQQAQCAKTQQHSKLQSCMAGDNMSSCPLAVG